MIHLDSSFLIDLQREASEHASEPRERSGDHGGPASERVGGAAGAKPPGSSWERPGGAFEFLETLDDAEVLAVSAHVVCELRVGVELSRKPLKESEALDHLMSSLVVVYPDERFPVIYARLLAAIQRSGGTISAMDLLIAATALVDDAPLVTRNVRDFSRVPGLRVFGY